MRILGYIPLLIILILGISFACFNAETVTIDYYFGKQILPLSLLLVITCGSGILLGIVMSLFSLIRLKVENRKLQRRVKLVEAEIANLRTMPLKDAR